MFHINNINSHELIFSHAGVNQQIIFRTLLYGFSVIQQAIRTLRIEVHIGFCHTERKSGLYTHIRSPREFPCHTWGRSEIYVSKIQMRSNEFVIIQQVDVKDS